MVLMSVTPTTELLVFELFQKLPCTSDTLVSYSGEWDPALASGELSPGGVKTSGQIIRAQSDLREVTQWLQEPHQEVFLSLAMAAGKSFQGVQY